MVNSQLYFSETLPYSLSVSMSSVIPNKWWKLWGYLLWNWNSAKIYLQRSLLEQQQLIPTTGAAGHRVSLGLPDWIGNRFLSPSFLLDTKGWVRLCTPGCQICRFGKQIVRQIVQESGRRWGLCGVVFVGWGCQCCVSGSCAGRCSWTFPSFEAKRGGCWRWELVFSKGIEPF